MSNLLLTSAGFENPKIGEEFLLLINKPVSGIKILFIPTAAITEEQMKFVNESRFELLKLGIVADNIYNFNLDYQISYDEVKNVDAIYACGGNTLHLLNKIKEIQFDIILRRLIDDGKLYVGVSAGSIVLGPKVKDQSGLNIIDTIIMPHYCDEFHEKLVIKRKQTEFSITPLTDMQALLVNDMKYQIIE
ncbi:MAG: Type 1 glutamine amidotransferase-like domain-containing protein [Desulfobacterales bacterium]|nr:Type 1 glutamine amidotransferase-like domain-containing protein [Desulfobacterales bacterium]